MPRHTTQCKAPQHLQPTYEERFRCVGPACEDTCCAGWTVPIDKTSYEKYQLIPASALRSSLEEHIALTPEENSELRHAKMRMDAKGACPFLDTDKLCAIQKEHGAAYLSHTCASYPRTTRKIDGDVEKTLLMSCPEAARLVLLAPALMPALERAPVGARRYRKFERLVEEAARPSDRPMVYFWEVRSFLLLLLKDRAYPLWQRLFLMGMFSKRMDALVSRQQVAAIPKLLKDYAGMVSGGALRSEMERIPAQPSLQLDIVMTLLKNRLEASAVNRRFLECVGEFSLGIGYEARSTPDALVERYHEAFAAHYQPWFQRHERIFENYLTNYVFAHLFPFGNPGPAQGGCAWREYLIVSVHYALIKALLIGMAGHLKTAFDTNHAIKLIQSFARDAEHNRKYIEQTVNFLEANRLDNTNGMAALLRDGPAETTAPSAWTDFTTTAEIPKPSCR